MNTNQSIIWFTTHKCASTYAIEFLQDLAQDIGMTYVDYEGNFWENGQDFEKFISKEINSMFKTIGHIYGPFRQYYPIPEMEKYKVILMVRDPRDALTSLYFSMAYSHSIPETRKTEVESFKETTRKRNIDNFVIEESLWFRRNYDKYSEHLLKRKNTLLLKYEPMVADFTAWLSEMLEHLQVKPSNQLIKKLTHSASFQVKEENIYENKRQVQPGDHRRKLQIKTIEQLNLNFKEVLNLYGWLENESQEADELFKLNLERAKEKLNNFQLLLEQAKHSLLHHQSNNKN